MTEHKHTTSLLPQHTSWQGCYRDGWKGLIVSDAPETQAQLGLLALGEKHNAFVHPAKVSRGLALRLYTHLRDVYGLPRGAVVLDPFAGVGCLGLDALLMGYHYLGVELEPRFVTLAHANSAYWHQRFGPQPGSVRVLQGDSRFLRQVLAGAQATCCVASPPYGDQQVGSGHDGRTGWRGYTDIGGGTYAGQGQLSALPMPSLVSSPPYNLPMSQDHNGSRGGSRGTAPSEHGAFAKYGMTPGQLEGLPPGCLLASPPYANGLGKEDTYADHSKREKDSHSGIYREKAIADPYYGSTAGNLGNLPPGTALVASPPYEGSVHSQTHGIDWSKAGPATGNRQRGEGCRHEATLRAQLNYGQTPEQLGNQTGLTFWSECHKVLAEVAALLPPGAMAVWIVKAFVRDGALVDFPKDWQRLCEQHGFTTVEIIHASLVQTHGAEQTLWGETVTRQSESKSFFRRLAEKRPGAPRIDEEIVLITRRDAACL